MMSPIPLNKSNMSSFEELKNCEELVQVLATRSQGCQTCKKREFVDHLHFIVDEGCLLDPTDGIPELLDIRCGHCQSSQAMKICAKCSSEFYCNKACQKSHWSQHSKKCSGHASSSAQASVCNSLSNGNVCNGSGSIHVPTPLAQPAKQRPAVNTVEKEVVKVGKGDLVRISNDEVDRLQQKTSEVIIQKPVSKKINKIELISNDKFEFLLTFGSNPSNFYIQRSADAEKAGFITECLNRECPKKNSWEGVKTLEVGQFCAGLYDTDGNWYRAKLLQKTGDDYHINFVDFGNPDTVKAANLRPLPVELIDTPALAIHCKLHDLTPNKNGDWSEESVAMFGGEVESGTFSECQVHCCNKDGIYSVDLFTITGASISDLLIKAKLAKRTSTQVPTETKKVSPKVQPSQPKMVEESQSMSQHSKPKIEELVLQPVVPPAIKVINQAEVIVSPPANSAPKSTKISLSNLRKFRKSESKLRSFVDELEVSNKPLSAIFTNVFDKSKSKYSIMFNVEMFCDISNDLAEVLNVSKSRVDGEVGKFVAVKAEDDEWHRAYILKVNEDGSCSCLFLDVGFVGDFNIVYALPSQFFEKPSLFSLATALGESSQKALMGIKCDEPIPVSVFIAQKGDELLGRVRFDDSTMECNVSLKSYMNAIKEITESLNKNPLDTLPCATLNGGEQSVLVVFQMPNDLSVFYAVPDAEAMGKIMENSEMQHRLGKPIENPEVGAYCFAKSKDNEWYRAVITEVNGGKCRVYFVDFGNDEKVTIDRLLSINPQFSPKVIPAQAVKCVLKESSRNERNYQAIATAIDGNLLKMDVLSKVQGHYVVAI